MTYPHERQIEYWTSKAIEDYFDNEGYNVVVLPNSQRVEKIIPYDYLFAGKGIKIFGLQYKKLHKGSTDHWRLDIAQYMQLKKFHWIYYALPQVTSLHQRRNCLHLLTIVRSEALSFKMNSSSNSGYLSLFTSELGSPVPYARWGGFTQGLFACHFGWKPSSPDELITTFADARELRETMIDLYIVPFESKLALRITPFVTDINANLEDSFDFGIE